MDIVGNSGIPSTKEEHIKELARWEQHHSEFTPRGTQPGNPYTKREFPMMIYRAQQHPQSGKWCTAIVPPAYFGFRDMNEWDRACQAAAIFTQGCQRIVRSEAELDAAIRSGEGWRQSAEEAMKWRESLEDEISTAAAERHFSDRKLSPKAQAEAAKIEAETFGHVPVIPEKPRPRKGKKAPVGKSPAA
jgi:hypothetical protein